MQVAQARNTIRRIALYTQSVEDAAKTLRDAVNAIAVIEDPAERARAATELLKAIGPANNTLSEMRAADIKTMRAAGMSYRQIGAAIGVHFTRVKQIESGVPTGNSARSRAERKPASA
jgi:ribosomal protein L10